jgi:hypothetical protein
MWILLCSSDYHVHDLNDVAVMGGSLYFFSRIGTTYATLQQKLGLMTKPKEAHTWKRVNTGHHNGWAMLIFIVADSKLGSDLRSR